MIGGRVCGALVGVAVKAYSGFMTTRSGRQASNKGGGFVFRRRPAPSAVVQCLRIGHHLRARANLGQESLHPATVSRRLGSMVAIRSVTINFEEKSVVAGWERSTRPGIDR